MKSPFETKSDSFYFVQWNDEGDEARESGVEQLIMHNKAEYRFV